MWFWPVVGVVSIIVMILMMAHSCRTFDSSKYAETPEQRMKREQKYRHKEAVHGDNYVPHRDLEGDH